jgi:hypothetical protein
MTPEISAIIHGFLDGAISESDEARLNAWIKAAPENAMAFADMARLYDRLHNLVQAKQAIKPAMNAPTARIVSPPSGRSKISSRRVAVAAGGLAALAAIVLVAWWGGDATPLSAAAELNRLIDASGALPDRTYRITSLGPGPKPIEARQAPIDRATLYIRSPDKYVLVRRFSDGRVYATGFDGQRNWSAPPDGAVRLSHDPLRFRWALPGHQHGIPFADLRSDLIELRDAYTLSRIAPDASGRHGLRAEKKSHEYRGPNRVDVYFDINSGVVHRMVFDGLPQARGGPKSVAVELIEQRPLGDDFFQHDAHHAAGRRVVEED